MIIYSRLRDREKMILSLQVEWWIVIQRLQKATCGRFNFSLSQGGQVFKSLIGTVIAPGTAMEKYVIVTNDDHMKFELLSRFQILISIPWVAMSLSHPQSAVLTLKEQE